MIHLYKITQYATHRVLLLFVGFCVTTIQAANYCGRIVDKNNLPIPYATVYLANNPIVGTATNAQGIFTLSTDASPQERVIISFIGYTKQELPLGVFCNMQMPYVIELEEQPIALEETVVAAPVHKQKNKRKAMATLLYKVYNRMQIEFPDTPSRYRIVSDVSMNADNAPWGMEQMIATTVHLPRVGKDRHDSIQFAPEHCKRFLDTTIRQRADAVLSHDNLNPKLRVVATEADSGVMVHWSLWRSRDARYHFEESMKDLRHWSVSNESEQETVLTYTEKHNYMGIFKITIHSHYIVDSETFSLLRFSEDAVAQLVIPFGYKLKSGDLELLNLLNVDDQAIERFRLRRIRASVQMNTLFQMQDGVRLMKERNLQAHALLLGTRKAEIPLDIKATQRATVAQNKSVQMLTEKEMSKRIEREIVPLY